MKIDQNHEPMVILDPKIFILEKVKRKKKVQKSDKLAYHTHKCNQEH